MKVSRDDIKRLLDAETLTEDIVYDLTANLGGKAKYKLSDEVLLEPKDFYGHNARSIKTSIGRLIWNIIVIKPVAEFTGFINEPVTKGVYGRLNKELSMAYTEDKITRENFIKFSEGVDKFQTFYAVYCSSNTEGTMKPLPKTMKRKKELMEKHKDAIEQGDPIIGSQIEEELLKIAKEEVGDDPGLDIYKSGAKGSFDNNFKNMNIMIGPIFDSNSPSGFSVITKSYSEGFSKSDIPAQANLIVDGAYNKGINTQVGGKMVKDWYSKYQSEVMAEEGTDCGTKETIKVKLTNNNINDYVYNYIMENGEAKMLTLDNKKQYVGSTVNMRNPSLCQSEKYCSICGGKFYYIMEYKFVGLTLVRIVSDIMNANLKKFHDVSVKLHAIEIEDLYI